MTRLEAALDLRRFGPIWPQTPQKTGYRGTNGSRDATDDPTTIERWCSTHRDAVFAVMTGVKIVALDIDRKNGRDGLDTLEDMGVSVHPETPTAHTPNGGFHLLFRAPDRAIRSSQDKLGPGLEVKAAGGWITLPPGPGRSWDPHLGPDTPLADMPPWMVVIEQHLSQTEGYQQLPVRPQPISRYAEAALDGAVAAIVGAPAGQQHDILNREVYGIARLVAGGVLPAALAIEALQWAARQMRSHDQHRPWRPADTDKAVRAAFSDGLARPRQPSRAA